MEEQADSSLCGLRYVTIPRSSQNGFGFTLRHFIIYPPEVCSSSDDKGHQNLVKVTEPVDTIFVKSVRQNGRAEAAGLCVGDRIVAVNGQRIVGKSYEEVVHLIQKSAHCLYLEVSPKQYDTLQLFYEDKAYRPETNQRPELDVEYSHPRRQQHNQQQTHYEYNYQYVPPTKMSSNESTNQQPQQSQHLLSHLPRPTPYKSSNSSSWSHLATPINLQRQSYYPFQKHEPNPRRNGAPQQLYGIREESATTTKSAESVVTPNHGPGNKYGSMESLPNNSLQWKYSPRQRFSIGPEISSSSDTRRESTISLDPSNEFTVTIGGSNEVGSKIEGTNSQLRGYEVKMADRIRKSCEQKEEFLRRPNQPWVPNSQVVTTSGFPKELYAQPQKFQKVPWPPESTATTIPPTLSSTTDHLVSSGHHQKVDQLRNHSSSLDETSTRIREPLSKLKTKSSVDVQQHPPPPPPSWNVTDYTSKMLGRNRLTVVGGGKLHCDPPKDWVPNTLRDEYGGGAPSSISLDHLSSLLPRNYIQLPGTLLSAVSRTRHFAQQQKTAGTATNRLLDPNVILRRRETSDTDDNDRLVRRVSYLKATSSPIDMDRKNASSPTTPVRSTAVDDVDHVVTLRKASTPGRRRSVAAKLSAEFFPKGRIIRLKQFFEDRTSDRSPASIFKFANNPSSELRHFGTTLTSEIAPDNSQVIREGQVHFKVRAGDAKKAGYYRSWRAGYAQVRRSGYLYLSKEKLNTPLNEAELCICLKDALVEAADDYTKKKYVVRIKTSTPSTASAANGGSAAEILLQIEDPFLQLKWIQTLQQQQDNNNRVSSSTLLNAPHSNSPYLTLQSSSPKSKTWKGKVARRWKKISSTSGSLQSQSGVGQGVGATFGVLLEDCPTTESSLVPKILEFCVETVEERGLGIVGIYRIPGNNAAIGALIESLNRGSEPSPEQDPRWKDVHVISSLLKSFLRKLPDPLLTSEHYPAFIEAVNNSNPISTLRTLINGLPDPNYETLRYLIHHLRKVADHCEVNRMEARNLAIVFGPTVVRTSEENVELFVNDMQHQCRIMELLIENVDELFKEKDECPTPEEDVAKPAMTIVQPRIESEIKASLLQAAQRKVLSKVVQPNQNVYGLPPPSSSRPVDSSTGLIRSYAGLGEETEQRVKQFELETRALLHRDARSPTLSNRDTSPVSNSSRLQDGIKQSRMRVEAEWMRAKHDLENEDYYDQLADNPSSIVEHRSGGLTPTHVSGSSNNSSGVYGVSTWPVRLGPTPFKLPAAASADNSPPAGNLKANSESNTSATLKRLKNYESLNHESKVFGSLDSLRDVGSREDLAARDENDVPSDNKLQLDRNLPANESNLEERQSSPPPNCNGSAIKSLITHKTPPRRSKSMINRRRSDILVDKETDYEDSQITALDSSTTTISTPQQQQLSKEAKTVSNKLKRECRRRRHSLNGTADILRSLMFGKAAGEGVKRDEVTSSMLSSSNNLLESHV